jgi:NAD(P)-dependent dehydrogenase (short-subunit alcohol dehydrogenase family)
VGDGRRAILVTGASSGIGLCLAEGLRARGYRIFATARQAEALRRIEALGCEAIPLDLRDPRSVREAAALTLRRCGGRLYGLIHNAGYGQIGALETVPREALRAQLEVNLLGPHELTLLCLPALRHQGQARIVVVGSILGQVALPWRGAYVASKHALEGWADTLRLELHGSGIHVALVEPGGIATGFRAAAGAGSFGRLLPVPEVHAATHAALEALYRAGPAPGSAPPTAVLRAVVRALEDSAPRRRYYVTALARLLALARRGLPPALLDHLLLGLAAAELRWARRGVAPGTPP